MHYQSKQCINIIIVIVREIRQNYHTFAALFDSLPNDQMVFFIDLWCGAHLLGRNTTTKGTVPMASASNTGRKVLTAPCPPIG